MNNSMKQNPSKTEKQKKDEMVMMLLQKRANLAEAILCSLCHGAWEAQKASSQDLLEGLVDTAVDMANKMVERLYVSDK